MEKNEFRDALFKKYFEIENGILVSDLVDKLSFLVEIWNELRMLCKNNIEWFSSLSKIKMLDYNNKKYLIIKLQLWNYVIIDIEKMENITEQEFKNNFSETFFVENFGEKAEGNDIFNKLYEINDYNGNIKELIDFYIKNEKWFSIASRIHYKIEYQNAWTYFNINFVNKSAQIGFETNDQFLYEQLYLNYDLTPSKMQDAQNKIGIEKMREMFNKIKDIKIPIEVIPNDLYEQYRFIIDRQKILNIINKFINEMGYKENQKVLGIFFYGSYLTGHYNENSDIDLHIIFDNSDKEHLIRGNKVIDGIRIEYFEKPINDLYLSVDNDYENQNNAFLSIIGTSMIIYDTNNELKKLQEYTKDKFFDKMLPLSIEQSKEYVSIINNRIEKLKMLANEDSPYFYHLYHLTIEKIRKFYHRYLGITKLQTSKVFKIYTDEKYRNSFDNIEIPETEFIIMYLNAITDTSLNKNIKLDKVIKLFEYSKRNIEINENEYRIKIKSRNL